jgi:G3E family GTPase
MQAQYTDLILLSKHELVGERELDDVVEKVNELNTDTPKLKWTQDIDTELFFGLDTKLFLEKDTLDQVHNHHEREVDLILIKSTSEYSIEDIETLLKKLPKDEVYRVKGLFPIKDHGMILNWAFERWTWTRSDIVFSLQVTVMGVDLFQHVRKFEEFFQGGDVVFSPQD